MAASYSPVKIRNRPSCAARTATSSSEPSRSIASSAGASRLTATGG